MNNKKSNILIVILIGLMSFILLGCGGGESSSSPDEELSQEQSAEIIKRELTEEECQRALLPSTVFIVSRNFLGYCTGTGLVLDDQGHILTNAHLVIPSGLITLDDQGHIITDEHDEHPISATASIVVQDPLSKKFDPARLKGSYPGDDLALIEVVSQNLEDYRAPDFGHSKDLLPGNRVYALGYVTDSNKPLSPNPAICQASVYQRGVYYDYYGLDNTIQIEAALSHENSGGPLINKYGEVVGINTLDFASTDSASNSDPDSAPYSYTIPIETAQKIILFLLYGDIKNLGVGLVPNSPSLAKKYGNPYVENSLVIISLQKDSPLYKAGWCRFDLLCQAKGRDQVEGAELRYPGDLIQLIDNAESGTPITITGLGLYTDENYYPYESTIQVP